MTYQNHFSSDGQKEIEQIGKLTTKENITANGAATWYYRLVDQDNKVIIQTD